MFWSHFLLIFSILTLNFPEILPVDQKLCSSTSVTTNDIYLYEEIGGRNRIVEAWLNPKNYPQMGGFIQLPWDEKVISRRKKKVTWRVNSSEIFERKLNLLRYPGVLIKGKFSIDPYDTERFRKMMRMYQLLHQYDPEHFSQPYGCITHTLSSNRNYLIQFFAIKSPLGTFSPDCPAFKRLCFYNIMKTYVAVVKDMYADANLLWKKRVAILYNIARAVASLHRAGITYNKISPEALGVQDKFINHIKLYDLEWAEYEGEKVFGMIPMYADMERLKAYLEAEKKGSLGHGFDRAEFEVDVWAFAVLIFEMLATGAELEKVMDFDFLKYPDKGARLTRETIYNWIESTDNINQCYILDNNCFCFLNLMNKMLELERPHRLQNFEVIVQALEIMIKGDKILQEKRESFLFSVGVYCRKIV